MTNLYHLLGWGAGDADGLHHLAESSANLYEMWKLEAPTHLMSCCP